jgi:hypothetical protein
VTSDVVANVFCTGSRCTGHDVRRADVFCTDSMLQDMSDVPMFSAHTIDVQKVTSGVSMFSAQTVDYRTCQACRYFPRRQ